MPLKPDPTFYPSPASAAEGPPEELAYVVTLNTDSDGKPDALAVVDVNPESSTYGTAIGRLDMPNVGDELHHFGWNACSSALCPTGPHPHVQRRYLLVPGLRSRARGRRSDRASAARGPSGVGIGPLVYLRDD